MPFRFGLGPVFKYEWLAATRRWQLYAVRSLFVSAILAAIVFMWLTEGPNTATVNTRQLAMLGTAIYISMVFAQLSMTLLIAPAATAGAVCLDKSRGTLDHMLSTDLSNSEIVLGKLGVRLVPLIGIVMSLLPAMVLTSLLGGVDPDALFGAFVVTMGTAVVACALALALSVWGSRTHEVLFAAYFLLLGWVLAAPMGWIVCLILRMSMSTQFWNVAKFTNPFYLAFAPYSEPGAVGYGTWSAYLAACVVISSLMVLVATIRLRAICLKSAGKSASTRNASHSRAAAWKLWARGPRFTFPGPTLDGNPVLWREWERRKPSRWMRVIWGAYGAIGLALTALLLAEAIRGTFGITEVAMFVLVFQVNVGLFLVNVQAASSLSEERMRGDLDVILSTPITTFEVLAGKWLGVWRVLPKLMILPALVSLIAVLGSTHWIRWLFFLTLISGYGATAISVGLACATWLSRLGRAISVSIGICVLFNLLVFAAMIVTSNRVEGELASLFVAQAGSLTGTGIAFLFLDPIAFRHSEEQQAILTCFLAIWSLLQHLFAAGLFLATWATFNRFLGRASTVRIARPRDSGIVPPLSHGFPRTASR